MDWTAPVDAYCERLGPSLLAEPLNAATNAAFLLAAAIGFRFWWQRRRGGNHRPFDGAGLFLVLLTAVIGVGSGLFHTFADRWSLLADTLPITAFIAGYFALALHRFGDLSPLAAVLATTGFLLASLLLASLLLAEPLFAPLVGSSAGYVPALLALPAIGAWLAVTKRPGARALLLAGAVFAASLAFRTLDGPLCAAFPSGTHFAWHLLNALTLGILLAAAVRHGPAPEPAAAA